MGHDLVRAHQGDVLQQKAGHALAVALKYGRIAPQAREVGCKGEDLLPLLLVEKAPIGLSPALIFLLRVGQRAQLLVPVRVQRLSDQAVVGVDAKSHAVSQVIGGHPI